MWQPANDRETPRIDITEDDLAAYAAGRLSRARRRTVEGYLAANPDEAARLMTRLHMAPAAPRRGHRRLVAATVSFALLACAGWSLAGWTIAEQRDLDGWRELDGEAPPDFVEDAAESRLAALYRQEMVSQVDTPQLDTAEIRHKLNLELPDLPTDWRVRDVQVFPTDDGPSVNVTVETPARVRLQLFAVRSVALATGQPELARRGAETVAFWKRGDAAYVLSGSRSERELLSDASVLTRSANL